MSVEEECKGLEMILEADNSFIIPQNEENCECKPSVLIVDDTEFNIIPVERMLKNHFNIDVHKASNGQIAVDMFKQRLAKPCRCAAKTYRLILMDLSMPVLSGEEASKAILKLLQEHRIQNREAAALEDISIVAVTSHTNNLVEANCLRIGMKAVFNKPLGLEDLRSIMEQYFLES